MKPRLPTKPTKDVDKLSASWICQLLDCIDFGMNNPRGDGVTILNQLGGTLRTIARGGGAPGTGGSSGYDGPFAVVKKDATTVTLTGSVNPNDVDSQNILSIESTSLVVDKIDVVLTSAKTYICLDFWYDSTVSQNWKKVVVASVYVYPQAADYASYPTPLAKVTRYVLANTTWSGDDPPAIRDIIQYQYGIINARGRAY